MIISKNTIVSLHYRLQEDDIHGELVEETYGGEPLYFLFGAGQMLPEFERHLEGRSAGDQFSFGIKCEDAYGEFNPDAVVMLPLDIFRIDGELAKELLVPGRVIPMHDDQGNSLSGTVLEVTNEGVILDFNHPMAGQDLWFTGTIESVREATPAEIAHGHVHGPGGYDH